MKVLNYQELIVWKKGHKLTLEIYKITKKFPKEEKFGLTSQVRRSAASVCANIAEGYKRSRKEFIQFLVVANGSLEETKYHLILAKDLLYFQQSDFNEIYDLAEEAGRMLNGLIRSLK